MIFRSLELGIIPYSFRIIPSVLLGAQIHRDLHTPGPFDNPVGALGGEPGQKNSEYQNCKYVYGFVHLKEHLGLFEQGLRLLSVILSSVLSLRHHEYYHS